MFGWFRAKCPIAEDDRRWIEHRMAWLIGTLGAESVRRARVVLPTEEFFPDPYDGSPSAVRAILDRVCAFMAVDPSRIELLLHSENGPTARSPLAADRDDHTGGRRSGKPNKVTMRLETSYQGDPLSLVAALSHGVGRFCLLEFPDFDPAAEDLEPLADLVAVCLGLGVFGANAAIRDVPWHVAEEEVYAPSRPGYLTAPMFGYALAWFARYRDELTPVWAKQLRPDALDAFRKGLRYLEKRRPAKPSESGPCPAYPPGAFRPPRQVPTPEDQRDESGEPGGESSPLGETHHEGCVARGMLLADGGDFDAAVRQYTEAIQTDPNDAEVYQLRGYAWWRLGEHARAIADAEQAIRLDPDDCEGYRIRGLARFGRREFEAALADFNRVLDDEPDDAEMYYWCGRALAAQGHHQRALRQYHQAIRHAPVRAEYYLARAEAYERLGHREKAQADRDEARRRAEA